VGSREEKSEREREPVRVEEMIHGEIQVTGVVVE
jgi:hypothetical protein